MASLSLNTSGDGDSLLPGQPIPMPSQSLFEELFHNFPNFFMLRKRMQLKPVSSYPGSGSLEEETGPHLAASSFQAAVERPYKSLWWGPMTCWKILLCVLAPCCIFLRARLQHNVLTTLPIFWPRCTFQVHFSLSEQQQNFPPIDSANTFTRELNRAFTAWLT